MFGLNLKHGKEYRIYVYPDGIRYGIYIKTRRVKAFLRSDKFQYLFVYEYGFGCKERWLDDECIFDVNQIETTDVE